MPYVLPAIPKCVRQGLNILQLPFMETIAQLFYVAVVLGLKTETKTRVWGHHSGFQLKRHREKRTEHLFQSSISYIIDIWLILIIICILPKKFSLISQFAHAVFFFTN